MDKYRGAGGAANKKVKFPELTVADCATLPRSCTSFYTDHEDLRIKHGSPRAGRRRDLDLDVRSIAVEHEVRSRSA
jgi:hypothetical protein